VIQLLTSGGLKVLWLGINWFGRKIVSSLGFFCPLVLETDCR